MIDDRVGANASGPVAVGGDRRLGWPGNPETGVKVVTRID
jgi:hypothetical protein